MDFSSDFNSDYIDMVAVGNPNHLLEDYQIRRNKNIIYVMVVIDVALYGIFCKTNIAMAHSEMMFIILVALTLLAGVMKNKRIGKNEFKGEMLCMKDVLNK